ncbi:Ppx/GppA phosphatase family protein [Eubacterium barkeri]|uniref:Ppx/GppA phosphatase n=1 Tax=Eubacterium barkeri TaxID=1528 RepID=A0A1H3H554_EUBBA|nr:Ppx/GppA phosphatase family protein [Eubacterium barkeri]SDY09894.1 Ppx/GppA phosphatase [Eubacterium barkeri]
MSEGNCATPPENRGNRAVIDIGTNSTRLLIFRQDEGGNLVRVNKSVRYTRMGQDVGATGSLHPDAMKRNMDALAEYKAIAADYGVKEYYIFGTSAMRDADNTGQFIDSAKEKLGLDVVVVSGEQEAAYGFIGASQCFEEPILIFDIGGGSTELIYGEGKTLDRMVSLNMGCVRGTEAFIHQDPPTQGELDALKKDVSGKLMDALGAFKGTRPKHLIGIGGTATTLSTIEQGLTVYDSQKVHGSLITRESLGRIINELAAIPLEERRKIAGLEAKRADIIIAGACILEQILAATQEDAFIVCDYDNLEGAAYSAFLE